MVQPRVDYPSHLITLISHCYRPHIRSIWVFGGSLCPQRSDWVLFVCFPFHKGNWPRSERRHWTAPAKRWQLWSTPWTKTTQSRAPTATRRCPSWIRTTTPWTPAANAHSRSTAGVSAPSPWTAEVRWLHVGALVYLCFCKITKVDVKVLISNLNWIISNWYKREAKTKAQLWIPQQQEKKESTLCIFFLSVLFIVQCSYKKYIP